MRMLDHDQSMVINIVKKISLILFAVTLIIFEVSF